MCIDGFVVSEGVWVMSEERCRDYIRWIFTEDYESNGLKLR